MTAIPEVTYFSRERIGPRSGYSRFAVQMRSRYSAVKTMIDAFSSPFRKFAVSYSELKFLFLAEFLYSLQPLCCNIAIFFPLDIEYLLALVFSDCLLGHIILGFGMIDTD